MVFDAIWRLTGDLTVLGFGPGTGLGRTCEEHAVPVETSEPLSVTESAISEGPSAVELDLRANRCIVGFFTIRIAPRSVSRLRGPCSLASRRAFNKSSFRGFLAVMILGFFTVRRYAVWTLSGEVGADGGGGGDVDILCASSYQCEYCRLRGTE